MLRRNTGKEELRARDLFYALWIPDIFMRRVKENGKWPLFCPNDCPDLVDLWGSQFESRFEFYEANGYARKIVDAQDVFKVILESQVETGTPYMLYKDAANAKSNQQNLGTIRCSNLCTEIIEYTAPDEVAVCNLASIALPKFVTASKTYDYVALRSVVHAVTRNLNRVIDVNYYPIPEAKNSNMRHRPIGIGVQGLADVFIMMKLPFASPEAKKVNKLIFETIYFAALEASCELSKEEGRTRLGRIRHHTRVFYSTTCGMSLQLLCGIGPSWSATFNNMDCAIHCWSHLCQRQVRHRSWATTNVSNPIRATSTTDAC